MVAALELLANETADSLADINGEMIAMRAVALQNRIALDLVLAAQGETCAVIGSECCTYIPDKSVHIASLTEKNERRWS